MLTVGLVGIKCPFQVGTGDLVELCWGLIYLETRLDLQYQQSCVVSRAGCLSVMYMS